MNGTKFNLTGTGVTSGTYETSYSSLVGKYLAMSQYGFDFVDIGSTTAGTMKTTTNIYALAYVVSATADNIEYKFLTSNKILLSHFLQVLKMIMVCLTILEVL